MQSELPESVRRAVCEYGAAAFNSGTAPDDAVATTDALTAREGAFAAIRAYGQQCREAERAKVPEGVRMACGLFKTYADLCDSLHPDNKRRVEENSAWLAALTTEPT